MNSRSLLAAATAAATFSLIAAGSVTAASGATSVNGHHNKRVCAAKPAGYASCQARVVTDAKLRPLATTSYSSGYSPAQLKSAYSLPASATTTTIAIVDAYANPNAVADLAKYRTQFGLGTAVLTQMNQNGGSITTVGGDTGWGQEEMLDLEMASAICPTCKLLYVGGSSTSFADLGTAVDRAALQPGVSVISNSYGGSESASETSYAGHYNHPGIAITVSSGDSGYGAQSPAVFNTVTAVGGTTLTLNGNGTRASETVWSGAGSGCSAYISKPSWQHDAGCTKRTEADVAAVADPATGVAVYDSYGSTGGANWFVFGGTSVAAPIIGGVYALSGNTAGVPAALAYAAPAGSLYDVTSGSNGRCRRGAKYLCTGVVGYDGPTGNGTPNGTAAF
ncbi:MAG: peptidase S8 [Actinomycetota bacterium]|nr:peptidase S8 [Actinomycetota bacterium]